MQATRLAITGALSVICAMAADGQAARTIPIDTVKVTFGGSCRNIKALQLVMNHNDQGALNDPSLEDGVEVWKLKPVPEIDPTDFFASVRLEDGRTDCRRPTSVVGRTATFHFDTCSIKPVHQVKFVTTATRGSRPIDIRYSRDFPPTDKGSVPCETSSILRSDFVRRVDDLWTELETLNLQVAYDGKDPYVPPSLLIYSPDDSTKPLLIRGKNNPDRLVFNAKAQTHAKKSGDPLRRVDVIDALEKQFWATPNRYGPNFRQRDEESLRKAGFETVVFEVQ